MEEITFLDVLTHYQIKLREITDEIEAIKKLLKKAEGYIDTGWSGDAAQACRLKLESVNNELSKTLAETSEALIKLSVIGDVLAEEAAPII